MRILSRRKNVIYSSFYYSLVEKRQFTDILAIKLGKDSSDSCNCDYDNKIILTKKNINE